MSQVSVAHAPIDEKRYVRHIEAGEVYLEHRATKRLYWYDTATANAVAGFFPRYLRFTKGEFYGRPFILQPWQADDWIKPMFGWKRVVEGKSRRDWPRRYKRARKWVPRKNGKTEELGGIGLVLLVADGEPGAEIYSIALDKQQASLVFGVAQTMAAQSPELSRELEFLKTSTYCPALGSVFRPLSGKPQGKHGFNPHGSLGDEVHEWESMDLHTFVIQGMGARRQPLDATISTSGRRGTVGYRMYGECEQILDGAIDDAETLVVIYAADPEDDWQDPAVWAKANPNLGVSISHEYLQDACRQATQLPRLENDFKRYHLNIWTEQDVRWLPMAAWRKCDRSEPGDLDRWLRLFEELRGRKCWGSLDLASTQDICALVWFFPAVDDDDAAIVLCRFWVPADTMHRRSKLDGLPYEQWVQLGAIEATEGNITDYNVIRARINEDMGRFDVQGLGVDKFNSSQMIVDMMADGIPAKWYPQTMLGMSPPSKELERLVLSGKLDHAGHPVLRWMAANAAVIPDHNGNIKPSKEKSSEKIDGVTALVSAIGMTLTPVDELGHPNVEAMPA